MENGNLVDKFVDPSSFGSKSNDNTTIVRWHWLVIYQFLKQRGV